MNGKSKEKAGSSTINIYKHTLVSSTLISHTEILQNEYFVGY